MKFTPSSIARRSTAFARSRSAGGPQMPDPVIRMAPTQRRLTVRSPPTSIVPAVLALATIVVPLLLRGRAELAQSLAQLVGLWMFGLLERRPAQGDPAYPVRAAQLFLGDGLAVVG